MRTSFVVSLVTTLCLGIGGVANAADKSASKMPKPGVVEVGAASITGTVEKIDYATREVTLMDATGKTLTMQVGPEAVRFNEVKTGDTVKIDYLESVAVMVQSASDSVSSAEGSGTVIVRNKTKKPSGTAVDTQIITATVVKIDAKKRKAVIKLPSGDTLPIDIASDVQHVENVKKGDQVVIKLTRTLAVSVSKP